MRGLWGWFFWSGPTPDVGTAADGVPVSASAGARYLLTADAGLTAGGDVLCCDVTDDRTIPIGADALVYYEGATTDGGTTYENAGTVTYVLEDEDGVEIDSGSLTYDGSGTGDYYGTIDRAVTVLLTEDATYFLEITYADADDNDDFRRIKYRAGYRGAT